MNTNARDVIVIGGGISGLTVAWHLKRAGIDVCLLEASSAVGGCTRTERRDGFLLEKGPFNVIIRDPSFEKLIEDLTGQAEVVTASRSARKRYIYRRGRLLAVPTDPIRLMLTPLLSFGARLRLIGGLFASRRAGQSEETIEQVATRRFGKQVSDTMVSSVISGIFAGDIRRLSLKACFPTVARVDQEARSLIGYGLASAFRSKRGGKTKHRRRWRGLVSIDGGLGAVTESIGQNLGPDLLSGCRVDSVTMVDGEYEVSVRSTEGGSRTLRGRRLCMATPALETGRLLRPTLPEAADLLEPIESASLVVLNLGYRRKDVGHPMDGFGFLVPHDEPDFPLMGVLWADSVFPHHASPNHRLMRVFIGGANNRQAVSLTDSELLATATNALRGLLELSGDPVLVDICRYPEAIPQYHAGHTEKIERLRAVIAKWPGLHVIGNYLEGVSLNDCVRLATDEANAIVKSNHSAGSPTMKEDHEFVTR